jgi:uncharacterized repeat protein (TIGR01451 family)
MLGAVLLAVIAFSLPVTLSSAGTYDIIPAGSANAPTLQDAAVLSAFGIRGETGDGMFAATGIEMTLHNPSIAGVTTSSRSNQSAANDSDYPADITLQTVDLAITKTVDNSIPNEGDTINYTVVLANNGPDTATNVEVTDVLPAGVTFVSMSATQGSYVPWSGVWSVGSVANAASDTLVLAATVDAGTNGQTIVNTATLTASDQADSNPANDSDAADLLVQSIDLAITKTVDNSVPNEGDSVNYTVALTNNGPDTATNVEVTDVLPAGVTFVSKFATNGIYDEGGGIWNLASIAPATSDTLTITVTVDPGTGGTTIVNTASVTASDQADSNPANDSDSADIIVQNVDLAITKTVDNNFPNEGDLINYAVVVANNGPDTATNVEVTDVLPAGVTFVSSAATQGSYHSGTGVWSVGSVANAASGTLTISATVDPGTGGSTIVNTATVTASDQTDNNPANDTDSASMTVQSVDLAVTKTVDNPAPNEGDTIVYTVALANGGPDTATGVELTDLLPAGVTFVSSTTTQGAYSSVTGLWTVGAIANAASGTLTITATVDAGAEGSTIENTATVTASDQADGNPANDSDSASITVGSVDLAVTKTVDNAAPNEEDTIVYTVTLTNGGPDTATGVELTDLLPTGVTFVSGTTTQGTYFPGTGVWAVGAIANTASATLTMTATVDAGSGGTTIVNSASVTASDQADSNPANDSDSASITIQSVDLSVAKTVDDPAPDEGDTIVYTVALTNGGPDAATGVQLIDLLPSGVSFVSSTTTQGSYVSDTGVWTIGTIANTVSDTLTITATVDAGTGGSTIVNTASVTASDQADSNPANDSDTAAVTVQSGNLPVIAGLDMLVTDPALTEEDLVNLNLLCPDCYVVGSPIISLRGVPLGTSPVCLGEPLGLTDTIVRRRQDTFGLDNGQSDTIEIEIVELHLRSLHPITVDCGSGEEEWTLDVSLVAPQPLGAMTITRTHQNGGTFTSSLPVIPHMTFTRVSDGTIQCETDGPQIDLLADAHPWVHESVNPHLDIPGCTSNFIPDAVVEEIALLVRHGVFSAPPATDIPEDHLPETPGERLGQNFPNPFGTSQTTIQYTLQQPTTVRLTIYNLQGKRVRSLVDCPQPAGIYNLEWDARDDEGQAVAPGVYFYELKAEDVRETRKMIHVR